MALTLKDLEETLPQLGFRRSVIAFVCTPEASAEVRDILANMGLPGLGLFGAPETGIEVLTDDKQPEPCLAFHDRETLREYLARNRVCATFGCLSKNVRWRNESDRAFYCEACAKQITAQSPQLPGFNDCQFVKI
jgi:hypothetical protein